MCSLEQEDGGHSLVEKQLLVMIGQRVANAAAELVLRRHGLMMGGQLTATNAGAEPVLPRHGLTMEKQLTATKAGREQENNPAAAGELALVCWADGGPSPMQAWDDLLEVSPILRYHLQSALDFCFGYWRRTLQAVQPLALVLSIHDGIHRMYPCRGDI